MVVIKPASSLGQYIYSGCTPKMAYERNCFSSVLYICQECQGDHTTNLPDVKLSTILSTIFYWVFSISFCNFFMFHQTFFLDFFSWFKQLCLLYKSSDAFHKILITIVYLVKGINCENCKRALRAGRNRTISEICNLASRIDKSANEMF